MGIIITPQSMGMLPLLSGPLSGYHSPLERCTAPMQVAAEGSWQRQPKGVSPTLPGQWDGGDGPTWSSCRSQ